MKERTFTETELVAFGNYILSQQRKDKMINIYLLDYVNDADLANFYEMIKTKEERRDEKIDLILKIDF